VYVTGIRLANDDSDISYSCCLHIVAGSKNHTPSLWAGKQPFWASVLVPGFVVVLLQQLQCELLVGRQQKSQLSWIRRRHVVSSWVTCARYIVELLKFSTVTGSKVSMWSATALAIEHSTDTTKLLVVSDDNKKTWNNKLLMKRDVIHLHHRLSWWRGPRCNQSRRGLPNAISSRRTSIFL
jgi:hypothetical protein